MARTDTPPNRVKRKDCKKCGGLGKMVRKVKRRIKNKDGSTDIVQETERETCNRCKGFGMELW